MKYKINFIFDWKVKLKRKINGTKGKKLKQRLKIEIKKLKIFDRNVKLKRTTNLAKEKKIKLEKIIYYKLKLKNVIENNSKLDKKNQKQK